jgi:hypothetical protein
VGHAKHARRLLPSSLLFPCPSWQTKTFMAIRAHWQLEFKIKKMAAGVTFYLLNIQENGGLSYLLPS